MAAKCLLRSLVIRKKNDSLERALGAKERRRRERRERREGRESDHGGLHRHLIITEQCPQFGRIPGQRDNLNILKSTFTSNFHRRFNVRFNVIFNRISYSCEYTARIDCALTKILIQGSCSQRAPIMQSQIAREASYLIFFSVK